MNLRDNKSSVTKEVKEKQASIKQIMNTIIRKRKQISKLEEDVEEELNKLVFKPGDVLEIGHEYNNTNIIIIEYINGDRHGEPYYKFVKLESDHIKWDTIGSSRLKQVIIRYVDNDLQFVENLSKLMKIETTL